MFDLSDPGRRVATQVHLCGRYRFTASLPAVCLEGQSPTWTAYVDGLALPMSFDRLEDAMIEAATRGRQAGVPAEMPGAGGGR